MLQPTAPPEAFRPRLRHGVLEYPIHHMRGGTSTGLVLRERWAPSSLPLREELLRHLMGVPLAGHDQNNAQITGLGRGSPTSNKVFFAEVTATAGLAGITSTLAQLANDHAGIDWSVNCGNMSAALQLWALDTGLIAPPGGPGKLDVHIHNTNTGILSVSRMEFDHAGALSTSEIPGVRGAYPAVDLFLQSPVGAKTGRLLPTGAATDDIEGFTVSCVDVAVPMVICDAREFGKTGQETIRELASDDRLKDALRKIWIAAGLRMGLRKQDGMLMNEADLASSETIPKICLVSTPAGRQPGGALLHAATGTCFHGRLRRLLPRGGRPDTGNGGTQAGTRPRSPGGRAYRCAS
jgi:4-oxalomesaconate tautomerase